MIRFGLRFPGLVLAVASCVAFHCGTLRAEDDGLKQQAQAAMRQAAEFYRTKAASHGGYVYYYSVDLSQRWGEGVATQDQVWVQPPGTPTVGMAYLTAYAATKDRYYLEAAKDAADALIYGQLKSGGWTNSVDFNPRGDKVALYRNGKGRGKDNSTLDDGITPAALRLLMRLDQALDFKEPRVHEAVQLGLAALLDAQFANGAFPQVWTGPVPTTPVKQASFPPHDWRTQGRIKNYWDMYTLNDNVCGHVAAALIEAHEIYGEARFASALARLGDFLILAQLPEPQPAWSQQYSYEMHPIWARRFEPPAVTGGESQDALETLMKVYRRTRDKKYLEPIPRALAYLKRSLLPDGRLARHYELKTNKPLYMTRRGDDYTLTYDDSQLPDHYGWKRESRLAAIEAEYQSLVAGKKELPTAAKVPADHARRIVGELDGQGRWISTYAGEPLVGQPRFRPGTAYISSAVFSQRLDTLSQYLSQRN
jgi:PelA/Pel-15E family pectate lyase